MESEDSGDKENAMEEQQSSSPNHVGETLPVKKKFRNTVFASKMRQRRKEERLKNLVLSGNLETVCKQVSVDVTRLAPNAVPKTPVKADHKVRKKKKPAWASGVIVKKKSKKTDQETSRIKPSDHSKMKKVNGTVNVDQEVETDSENESTYESRDGSEELDKWSCRRTEPFIGKLISKEDRAAYIKRFEEQQTSASNSALVTKEVGNDQIVNLPTDNDLENDEGQDNVEKETIEEPKHIVKETNQVSETEIPKCRKFNDNLSSDGKEHFSENLQDASENIPEPKEKVIPDAISCRRTMPFVGKTPRKPSSGVPEKPIEIISSSEANAGSDSEPLNEEVNSKITPTNSSEPVKETETEDIISKHLETVANCYAGTDGSTLHENDALSTPCAENPLSEQPSKNHSERLNVDESSSDATKENPEPIVKSREEVESNASGSCNIPTNSTCTDLTSSRSESPDDHDSWSCRRAEVFEGGCRRTKLYIRPTLKVTDYGTDQYHGLDLPAETVTPRLKSSDADIFIQELRKRKEKDVPAFLQEVSSDLTSTRPESPALNGEWKFRRKREKTPSDDDLENDEAPVVQHLKKSKVYSSPNTKNSSSNKGSLALSVLPKKMTCSSQSILNDVHPLLDDECPIPPRVTKEVSIVLTRLEKSRDPLAVKFIKSRADHISEPLDTATEPTDEISSDQDDKNYEIGKDDSVKSDKSNSVASPQPAVNFHDGDLEESIGTLDEVFEQMESVSSIRSGNSKNVSSSEWSKKRKSRASRESSASPIIAPGRRRKAKSANYVDESSDSDGCEMSKSINNRVRGRSQGQASLFGPTLRKRNKSVCYSNEDEDDLEVEAFSRRGRKRRILSSDEDENCTEIAAYMTRARSRGPTIAIKERQSSSDSDGDDPTPGPPTVETLAKQIEKFSSELDHALKSRESGKHRHRPRSRLARVRRTSSGGEFNQENDAIVDGSLSSSMVQRSSGSVQKQTPKLNNELKVQLVRLESVCSDYNEFPADAIERLTEDYMSSLSNSKSNRGTWCTPINYHQLRVDRQLAAELQYAETSGSDDVGADDVSDIEKLHPTTEPPPDEHHPLDDDSRSNLDASKTSEVSTREGKSPRKTPKKKSVPKKSPFENLIKALQQQEDSAAARKDLPAEDDDKQPSSPAEPEPTEQLADDDESREKTPEKVMVNGTVFLACHNCNKIFTGKALFEKHQREAHKDIFDKEQQPDDNESSVASLSVAPSTSSSTAVTASETTTTSKQAGKQGKKEKKRKGLKKPLVPDTKCTICSVEFETKDLLFEHIMKHNGQELNQAYETEKKKLEERRKSAEEKRKSATGSGASSDESDGDEKAKKAKKDKLAKRKSTDSVRSSIEIEILEEHGPPHDDQPLNAGAVLISNMPGLPPHPQSCETTQCEAMANIQLVPANPRPVVICPCHANESTNKDLQIEMVLTCKVCFVVFRRRDCFEVHFRSSPECRQLRANNENTKVPKLFCSGCPAILDSLILMRAHLEQHARNNSQGTVTFLCNICKVAFFGVGTIFYQHWYSHAKSPDFVASRYSFPKLSIVSVLEENRALLLNNKSRDGYFYIAEHVCRTCRLPFSSEPELVRHQETPCQPPSVTQQSSDPSDPNPLQFVKLICDLCKKYYVSKESFDKHCIDRKHLKTQPLKCSRVPIGNNQAAFMCGLCRTAKNNVVDIKEHWKRVHSPTMELYTCKTCNIVPTMDPTNYTYEKFEKHCKALHKNELVNCLVYYVTARYCCERCKYGFLDERTLADHKNIHARQRPQQAAGSAQVGRSSALPNGASVVLPPQAPAMWVAEEQVQPDGGRRVYPVYQNASANVVNVNGVAAGVVNNVVPGVVNGHVNEDTASSVASLTLNEGVVQLQSGAVLLNQSNVNANPASSVRPQVIRAPISNSAANNTMLRSMLINNANQVVQGPQAQALPQIVAPVVETIDLDSRSNSPVLDGANTTTTTANPTPLPSLIPISIASIPTSSSSSPPPKQSYMTAVNLDFETMIGSDNETRSSDSTQAPKPTLDNTSTPSESNNTVQPFEVVLLNDDMSDNSNGVDVLASDGTNSEASVSQQQTTEQPPQQPRQEISETKSFLRVRSVAELQSIKIHECTICDLSFEKLEVYEQHMKQHQPAPEPQRQQQSPVPQLQPIHQLQQQCRQMNANGTSSPVVQAQQPYQQQSRQALQQQQQQQQAQWYNCNGASTSSPSVSNGLHRKPGQITPRRSTEKSVPVNQASGRGPPPPYQSHVASVNRSGAIHLPERSAAGPNATKRPSGAATRIPQQNISQPSLPSFESLRQANVQIPYNCDSPEAQNDQVTNNSVLNQYPQQRQHHQQQQQPQQQQQLQYSQQQQQLPQIQQQVVQPSRNYSRNTLGVNYSNVAASSVNYGQPQALQQSQQQQQQPPQQIQQQSALPRSQNRYMFCRTPACYFKTQDPVALETHERTHRLRLQNMSGNSNQAASAQRNVQRMQLPQKVQQPHQQQFQQVQPQQQLVQNQYQQQQQHRLPVKHVSVSQMPTRPSAAASRAMPHAVPENHLQICNHCGTVCNSHAELVEHVAINHNNSASSSVCCFVCDYCPSPLLFDTEVALRDHMQVKHNFSCQICNKRYPSSEDLMLHMEVHSRNT